MMGPLELSCHFISLNILCSSSKVEEKSGGELELPGISLLE
jgi:hypothetical protein